MHYSYSLREAKAETLEQKPKSSTVYWLAHHGSLCMITLLSRTSSTEVAYINLKKNVCHILEKSPFTEDWVRKNWMQSNAERRVYIGFALLFTNWVWFVP